MYYIVTGKYTVSGDNMEEKLKHGVLPDFSQMKPLVKLMLTKLLQVDVEKRSLPVELLDNKAILGICRKRCPENYWDETIGLKKTENLLQRVLDGEKI